MSYRPTKRPRPSVFINRELAGARYNAATASSRINRVYKSSLPKRKFTGASPALRKAVEAIMQNRAEKKLDTIYPTGSSGFKSIAAVGPATGPDFLSIYPQPAEGTSGFERIGDSIRISQANLRFTISLQAAQMPVPVTVTMMIGKMRNNVGVPGDADWAQLFMSPAGTGVGASSGILSDILLAVNEDYWDIKLRKQYQIGPQNPATNLNHGQPAQTYVMENIDCKKYLKSVIKYDEAGTTPENDGLYVWFFYNTWDGSALGATTLPRVTSTFTTRFTDM